MNHRPTDPARQRMTLAQALRSAAAELDSQAPPPGLRLRVEAAARAHVAARGGALPARAQGGGSAVHASPAPWTWPARPWAWSGAAVCAAVLAGSALLMLRLPAPADEWAGERRSLATAFIPVVPLESWPADARGGSASPAWLVSTEMPGERLAALGLPYDPARAGASVRAQLLLHPSGEVLAVRLLR